MGKTPEQQKAYNEYANGRNCRIFRRTVEQDLKVKQTYMPKDMFAWYIGTLGVTLDEIEAAAWPELPCEP